MNKIHTLTPERYRRFITVLYLNASEALLKGLKDQLGKNDLHFMVTFRSFLEYARRGVWFLAFADEQHLNASAQKSFKKVGISILSMDKKINQALGLGSVCYLEKQVPGIGEPFIEMLHALTHGNPISAHVFTHGMKKVFQMEMLFARAQMEFQMFQILVYRTGLGEDLSKVWALLASINNDPIAITANVKIAAHSLHAKGLDQDIIKAGL